MREALRRDQRGRPVLGAIAAFAVVTLAASACAGSAPSGPDIDLGAGPGQVGTVKSGGSRGST